MDLQTWHLLSDNLTIRLFDHDHLWLHLIVHVVLVAMPTAFIGMLLWTLFRLRIFRLFGIAGINQKLGRTSTSFYKIPDHILSFVANGV